jgi:transcriptional regulator with PAS, ATPase and Fis domain
MAAMASDATHTAHAGPSSLRVRGARVAITRGPDAGRSVVLDQPTCVVGSGDTADIRLSDPSVSREHVRLSLAPNGIRVRDGGSKNGTWLGGVRVVEVMLTSDASVVLGGTTLAITLDSEDTDLPLSVSDRFGEAIGTTPVMRNVFAVLERVASTELSVLLEGETGTGKDLLARAIHARSTRAGGSFVAVDCASIPKGLVESELFGHVRGAFTGAERDREGVFEQADGGTLFLDEIGDLPLDVQPKLLRVLEARETKPVGGRTTKSVDVRVLAATSHRLAEAARSGEFRSDLFYRLAVTRVVVPPLRDRAQDILPIARAMLRTMTGEGLADFPPDFASMMEAYPWPGNVRELRNVVERFRAFGGSRSLFDGGETPPTDLDDELARLEYHEARKIVVDRFEAQYLPRVLERASGNVTRAAELAAIGRASFYRMLERAGRRPR